MTSSSVTVSRTMSKPTGNYPHSLLDSHALVWYILTYLICNLHKHAIVMPINCFVCNFSILRWVIYQVIDVKASKEACVRYFEWAYPSFCACVSYVYTQYSPPADSVTAEIGVCGVINFYLNNFLHQSSTAWGSGLWIIDITEMLRVSCWMLSTHSSDWEVEAGCSYFLSFQNFMIKVTQLCSVN